MNFEWLNFKNLKNLIFKKDNFLVSNVINMDYIFKDCHTLTSLNLDNFITSKGTSMNELFYSCYSLKYLNIIQFNTSLVIRMTWNIL